MASSRAIGFSPVPTFIIQREPDKYGGQQDDYVKQVESIVETCAQRFRTAVDNNEDLITLFHETLSFMANHRHRIAVEHGTKKHKHFGKPRNAEDVHKTFLSTPAIGQYQDYGVRINAHICTLLKQMRDKNGVFQDSKRCFPGTPIAGRQSSLEVEILKHDEKAKWSLAYTLEEFQRICALSNLVPPADSSQIEATLEKLIRNPDALRLLKEKSIEDYKRVKISTITRIIRHFTNEAYGVEHEQHLKGKKIDWVVVTLRVQIGDKMVALTQQITWMHLDCDPNEDPVDHIQSCAHVTLLHQDYFLIELMRKDIAEIFKRILTTDSKDQKQVMMQTGLFEYEFAHAMLFLRGPSAIGEWFEVALYKFHGHKLKYNPHMLVNLAALSHRLDVFLETYPKTLRLYT